MPSQSQNSHRWGETGIYRGDVLWSACGGGRHASMPFAPVCFICLSAIGRTVGDDLGRAKLHKCGKIRIKKSEVEWTQWYRAIVFDRSRNITLSEVGHIIYYGPWLELLKLPVTDATSGKTTTVEFFPLCFHENEAEADYDTFGCTLHATCWEFFERSVGEEIAQDRLASVVQVLREQMHSQFHLGAKKYFPCGASPLVGLSIEERGDVAYASDPKNIAKLHEIYLSCKTRRRPRGRRALSTLEDLYAALPPEIKLMIVEYLEARPLLNSFDIGHTLPEYWRKRLFREYRHLVFDAAEYGPTDLDWRLLYYKIGLLLSAGSDAPRGFQNRWRIFNILWGTRLRYIKKPTIQPTPKELRCCYLADRPGESLIRFKFG